MKYLFILGRNPELSIAEIVAVFGKKDFVKKWNAVLVLLEKIEDNAIEKFGGVYAIGETLCSCSEKEIEKKDIYLGSKNKVNYVLWDFSDKTESVREYLKRRFKSERVKATEKKLNIMKLQEGGTAGTSRETIEEEFFVFENYFGKIIQKPKFREIERRDMDKPVRREELSISPRLAKIMINLSKVKKDEVLLDPFCGIGVMLYEALLQKIKVIGIDLDKEAIAGARRNLEWGKFARERYSLINADSREIKINDKVNVIVTEPHLGEILKKIPTEEKAKEIINDFEKLIISVISNLKENVNGRIVFTAPTIQTFKKNKRISCDAERIHKATGFKLLQKPIPEFREGQVVGRELFVMGK